MKCKICEKEFELKKEEKYLATEKVAAFGTLAKLPKTFEAWLDVEDRCQQGLGQTLIDMILQDFLQQQQATKLWR